MILCAAFTAFCSQDLDFLKQLTDLQFELYTYEKRAEYLQQKVDGSEAAHMLQVYSPLLIERVAAYPRKKLLQRKKRYLAEEKEYLANQEEMRKKVREANLELSQMPEYQELQLVNKEIEKLKEKIQQILVLFHQSKA